MPGHASVSSLPRRRLLILAGAVLAGGGVFAMNWFNVGATVSGGGKLSVTDAHMKAVSDEILLIDIRRPDEWARTGLGEGAHPLDMRRKDFVEALLVLTEGRVDRPVALICARGVRSRHLTARLSEAGFSQIIDVPEGMLGSGAGPGWLRSGLPVVGL